ncbi:MAG: sigma-70 family RNA polymerase sigma factor [Myxococcales bacterium]|nr:sigma-70 family RNA polymerase sigma factor [Myxococcales bacterium]
MAPFPLTIPSAVRGLASSDRARRERCLQTIAQIYWTPIYTYLRLRHGKQPAEAEDIAQAFFARVIEGSALGGHDPERARFRTFLRTAVDHHVIDQHRRQVAARRGGGLPKIDVADCEAELATGPTPEDAFDREWLARVVALATQRTLDALERRDKRTHAELFRRFHLADDPPAYQQVATELGISLADVTNWLHVARREFRRVALALLRELTSSAREFEEEALAVFGIRIEK